MVSTSRRSWLKLSLGTVAVPVLAGCLGGNGDDDTRGEEPVQLGIEHTRFVAEQPTDYREYTEIPDATYDPGDVVWIYFEPVGLTTEDAGEGQVHIDVTLDLEVTGPDGETRSFEQEITRNIPEGSDDEQYLFWNFQPESPATSGEYTAEIGLVDELADERVTEAETFTIAGEEPTEELGIEHVRFVADQPLEYRQYVVVPDAIYGPDDVVWIYFEPDGLTTEDVAGDDVRFAVTTELTVTNPDGDSHQFEERFEVTIHEDELDEQFLFWNFQPESPVTAGDYVVEISLVDELSGRQIGVDAAFTIESGEPLELFQEMLETELDVGIRSLAVESDVVELDYESTFPVGSQENSREIGFIAGAYAVRVGQGWHVDELVATFTDGQGEEFRFHVSTELAQEFFDEELTSQEFADAVLETLEEREV